MNQSRSISRKLGGGEVRPGRVRLSLGLEFKRKKPQYRDGGNCVARTKEQRVETFWNYVDKTSHAPCWLWTGTTNRDGYGRFSWNQRLHQAHRISYYLHTGEDPLRHLVLHTCDTPRCVNPYHLFVGNDKDNAEDKKRKNRERNLFGEEHWKASITNAQAREIRERFGLWETYIASEYNTSKDVIRNVVRRRHWTK